MKNTAPEARRFRCYFKGFLLIPFLKENVWMPAPQQLGALIAEKE